MVSTRTATSLLIDYSQLFAYGKLIKFLKKIKACNHRKVGRVTDADMRSGRKRCMMAQKPRPFFQDDVMLVMLTSRYPSHCTLHHCCNALIFAAISAYCNNINNFWNQPHRETFSTFFYVKTYNSYFCILQNADKDSFHTTGILCDHRWTARQMNRRTDRISMAKTRYSSSYCCAWKSQWKKRSSSSSTTVGSMPVGVWCHCYYCCPPLPI